MSSEQKPRVWKIAKATVDLGGNETGVFSDIQGENTCDEYQYQRDPVFVSVVELSEVMKLIEALKDAKVTLLLEHRTTAASEIDEALAPWRSMLEEGKR